MKGSLLEQPPIAAARRRWGAVDVAARVLEGFRRHRGGRNVAVISHFSFISVFPLLIVFTTILGFVLDGRPSLRNDIIDSAMAQIPIVGAQIAREPASIRGNVVALVISLLASLWAGMRAFVAVHGALDDVAERPLAGRVGFLATRVRALWGIAFVGCLQIGTAVLASLLAVNRYPWIAAALLAMAAVAANGLTLALSYRWLCSRRPAWRTVLPGAAAGGVAYAALQFVGVAYVGRAVVKASTVYGTFASVIGLLSWMSVHAMIALLGAELNRSLAGHDDVSAVLAASDEPSI